MIHFSYDLSSPYAWLSAERIDALFVPEGVPIVWEPILLGGVFKATGRSSWALTDARADGIAEVERRARAYGLPDPVWAEPWPGDGLALMRAATWATRLGPAEGRAFAHAAFALHFVDGQAPNATDFIALAAQRAELSGEDAVASVADPEIKLALREATDAAIAAGVIGVPTFRKDGDVVFGDDQLDDAAARWTGAMGSLAGPPGF